MSRELTAWAGSWSLTRLTTPGIGPNLWQVAPGLGPPRPAQHESLLSKTPIQTVDDAFASIARPTGRLGGFPTGRPWVFASSGSPQHLCPENRALFRGPFLGSAASLPDITAGWMPLGRMPQLKEKFLLAWPLSTTGGDLNPTCLELLSSLVSGGLVAGRRSRRTRI